MINKLSAKFAILGVLMTGPKHGYDLHGYISSKMSRFWYLSTSQVYALLKSMENEGLVASKVEQQERRPAKTIISLTRTGRESFTRWVYSPVEHVRDLRIEFMAKLFFIKELELADGLALIDRQKNVLKEKLSMIESSRDETDNEFQSMLDHFKFTQTTALLDWLEKCKALFNKNMLN